MCGRDEGMALKIRDPEAQRLARKLADATGETMTRVLIKARQERLERRRLRQKACRTERGARLMAHGKRFAALPVLDPRSADEIIGYDEGSEVRG
jgi:antitoxin VapB